MITKALIRLILALWKSKMDDLERASVQMQFLNSRIDRLKDALEIIIECSKGAWSDNADELNQLAHVLKNETTSAAYRKFAAVDTSARDQFEAQIQAIEREFKGLTGE